MQCHDADLDYVDEEGEMVEKEEIVAEELDDERNPKRSEGSEVSCLDSDSEETSEYSSTRNIFSESGVRKQRTPKVRHRKAVSYTHLDVYKRQCIYTCYVIQILSFYTVKTWGLFIYDIFVIHG